ncbi:F0F1 ATP synthase subunit delta [Mesomycoplasma molare]|uniref:ATP synthase subunit delta n=1 Tax=Mesomycoplasma molare TaxID=171288 RepID=A0ABY5TZB4_9BACT|nr:F0F1 ATP synthase subunit delta [Mesomycoplasma molare]UWD34568.1 F0F1 ATP synthase subunit delta [Mesomycoplasma molare]
MHLDKIEKINGYALAIFQIALEEEKIKDYYKQTEKLKKIFTKEKELLLFLKSFEITLEEKENFIDTIFKTEIENNLLNVIKLLVKTHFIDYINEIFTKFEIKVLKYLNMKKAYVYSVYKLDKNQISKIKKFIESKINKKIILKQKIDKSLIAGLKIMVDDLVFENSIYSQLKEIKEFVLKEGSVR